MNDFRVKGEQISEKYDSNKMDFDESTYHYSSQEKEQQFINAQFVTEEEKKNYKIYREEWHRRADKLDAGGEPLAVICELVSSCNLHCEMCYTITPEFQDTVVGSQRMMPWEQVVKIVDECVEIGVYSILFSWRGESTMYRVKGPDGKHKDFADVLAYARDKGILEVTSLTNGRLMTPELVKKIVDAQPNWISFSVDGLGETYDKVREQVKTDKGQNPFDLLVKNIKMLVEERDRRGLVKPQIRSNAIFPAISENPERYKEFMEEIGVGMVTVNAILDYRGEEMEESDILDNWFCQYPFQRLVVSANGTIMACPGAHNEEEEVAMGLYPGGSKKTVKVNGTDKVIEQPEMTLMDAWNSDKLNQVRHLHATNRRKDIWACKHCRHGAKKYGAEWIPEEWDMQEMKWEDGRKFRNN
jgi:hypothetical protein